VSNGIGWLGLVGVALIVLGFACLVLVDAPRRVLKTLVRVVRPAGPRRQSRAVLRALPRGPTGSVEPLWVTPTDVAKAVASEWPPFVGSRISHRT